MYLLLLLFLWRILTTDTIFFFDLDIIYWLLTLENWCLHFLFPHVLACAHTPSFYPFLLLTLLFSMFALWPPKLNWLDSFIGGFWIINISIFLLLYWSISSWGNPLISWGDMYFAIFPIFPFFFFLAVFPLGVKWKKKRTSVLPFTAQEFHLILLFSVWCTHHQLGLLFLSPHPLCFTSPKE